MNRLVARHWTLIMLCLMSFSSSLMHGVRMQVRMAATMSEKSIFFSKKSFTDLGLNNKMIKTLDSLQISRPSKIQALSFQSIYSGKHCIIGDQTGSGKTLAYLLPTIQRMDEAMAQGKLKRPQERSPYIIIMTPTTELATQVAKVTRSLANALKFRTSCFTSMSDFDEEQRKLRLGAEVLVATPGRLLDLLKRRQVNFADLQALVLDEVDTLYLDESYPLQPIGEAVPNTTQFLFTSATLPEGMLRKIEKEFPGVANLAGPGLHRVAPHVAETLVDCSGPRTQAKAFETVLNNKLAALDQALLNHREVERTLIFCNTIEQCRRVENHLAREDRASRVRHLYAHHSAINDEDRERNLELFCKPLLKLPAVLICTDRASRGMDFDRAYVDHVILFDFPREPSEYLRRVGRTGRAGRPGAVTVLAYGKQVDAAKAVISASIEGKRIDPTDSDSIKSEEE